MRPVKNSGRNCVVGVDQNSPYFLLGNEKGEKKNAEGKGDKALKKK